MHTLTAATCFFKWPEFLDIKRKNTWERPASKASGKTDLDKTKSDIILEDEPFWQPMYTTHTRSAHHKYVTNEFINCKFPPSRTTL